MIPCIDCKKPIENIVSLKQKRCDDCKIKKKRADQKTYKKTHSQGCMYCGKWLVVPDSWSGLIYCDICGADGKSRKKEYVERG